MLGTKIADEIGACAKFGGNFELKFHACADFVAIFVPSNLQSSVNDIVYASLRVLSTHFIEVLLRELNFSLAINIKQTSAFTVTIMLIKNSANKKRVLKIYGVTAYLIAFLFLPKKFGAKALTCDTTKLHVPLFAEFFY